MGNEARSRWSEEAGKDIMEHARVQRESASAVHAELDDIENEYMKAASAVAILGVAEKAAFIRKLDATQDEVDARLGECEDRVAATILRAAAQKVSRLLEEASL